MNLPADTSRKVKQGNAVIMLTITAVCIATYFHCLFYGITRLDDDILITENLNFLQHLPNLFKVFTTDAFYLQKSIDLYRPIQSATFILDAQWGLNPVFVGHLTNLILHILTCLTVFRLLLLLEFRRKIAFFGALVYAVHFLFMAAVAWLPARGDLLLALFAFLALASFIKLITAGGWLNYLLHCLFFALAIFSKESAVVLPMLLALYLWAYGKKTLLTRNHLFLPLFYLAVQLWYFRLKSLAVVLYDGDTGLVPLLKNIRTLPETVVRFYLPLNISTLADYKLHATVAGVIVIAGLVGLHILYRGKFDRKVLFYVGWLLLFIGPAMLYYPAFYTFTYEHVNHRSYVTCFGLLLLSLNLVQAFELDKKSSFNAVCLLLLGYLAAFNFYYSRSYSNPAEFALLAIRTNSKSALGYQLYGSELYLQGKDDEALDNLDRSIRIFSKLTPALYTRALIYRKRGQERAALADLDTIVAFDPKCDAEVYTLRAQIKVDLQDYDGAAADYRLTLNLRPGNEEARLGLEELKRTVRDSRLLPNVRLAQVYNKQGIEAGDRGDFKGAEALFRKALATDPGFYGVNLNLGNALFALGRVSESCAAWGAAAGQGNATAAELLKEYCGQ